MLTPGILGSLRIPANAAPTAPALFNATTGQTVEATLEAILPEGLVLRLADGKVLLAQGSLPFPPGSALALKALRLPEGAGLRLQVVRATPPPGPALLSPLAMGEAAGLMERIQPGGIQSPLSDLLRNLLQVGVTVAEQPETWSTWMKEAMKTLGDPASSPAEATFHRLQAKEGTAWFELPLPWAPGAEPMRIWIEADRESRDGESGPVHRVFLSVPFSNLGEVRLGVEQRHEGLRVRLWLADPSQVSAMRPQMEEELAALGRPVDLQVLLLPAGTPDLRAMAGIRPLRALG